MQVTIRAEGPHARMVSHLLAKNPNNLYDRDEKGTRVRLVYTICTDDEVEALLYATPDPIELVQASPDSYDITQYINDREFVVSSLFCTYMRTALGTALNGKPKEEYAQWVAHPFSLTLSFGPVASNLPDWIIEELFAALGYKVLMERGEADYSFELKAHSSVRYITIRGEQNLQQALRQLFILIPVLDDYKHNYIGAEEIDKLRRYGEGWLDTHPQRELIVRRTLRFSAVIAQFEGRSVSMGTDGNGQTELSLQSESSEQAVQVERTVYEGQEQILEQSHGQLQGQSQGGETGKALQEPKVRLNELRYRAIIEAVSGLADKRVIVDCGSGEGKLAARLCEIDGVTQVLAVEPSGVAQLRAVERFEKLAARGQQLVPTPVYGSLFYYDERLRGKDVFILCEVIEHINEQRLPRTMAAVLGEYRPQTLIVTTPNKAYNAVYEMDQAEMRHSDHRFEWNREQFVQACEAWAGEDYSLTYQGIGEEAEGLGQPTQMAIFTRRREGDSR